jgi:hypothetical protein
VYGSRSTVGSLQLSGSGSDMHGAVSGSEFSHEPWPQTCSAFSTLIDLKRAYNNQ